MLGEGSRFGRLVVVEDRGHKKVFCRCDCGATRVLPRHRLRSGNTKSCGCLKSEVTRRRWEMVSAATAILEGSVFGRLTVKESHHQRVQCQCSCGALVWVRKYDLLSGKTSSCGCLRREVGAKRLSVVATVHGGWGTREWNRWWNMVRRCSDPSAMGYENYGGRGVSVCSRWQGSKGFEKFLEDLGLAPSEQHSLDRIDNEGHYEPGNVRWATSREQARNRRNNRMILAFGRTQCLAAWAEEVNLSPTTIRYRLLKGWEPEEALRRRR